RLRRLDRFRPALDLRAAQLLPQLLAVAAQALLDGLGADEVAALGQVHELLDVPAHVLPLFRRQPLADREERGDSPATADLRLSLPGAAGHRGEGPLQRRGRALP